MPWRGKYRLYWDSRPAPERTGADELRQMASLEFRTLQGALHAAALLYRESKFVWCIEGPEGPRMTAPEIKRYYAELLKRHAPVVVPVPPKSRTTSAA